MLKDRGVDVIFGIPGVHNQEMYRGIEEAGITHVLARHEQGAGFMADGYARATGKPGVAYVITGPGLCNIMTPMGQAYSDSVPMLVISSCLDETAAKRGQLHQMKDQEGAARTVCDWSETARSAEAAYGLIDRALDEFWFSERCPKAVHVPIALLEAPAEPASAGGPPLAGAAVPDGAGLHNLAIWLREARRPLFVFGGGARWVDFMDPLLRRWSAASFTTYAGRGIAAPEDPLHFGALLARPGSAEILESADLVIAVGTDLAETDLWRSQLGATAKFAAINNDVSTLTRLAGQEGSHKLMIHGDCFAALEMLSEILPENLQSEWSNEKVAAARSRWRAEIEVERPGILPVVDALKEALPADTMIYSDMTQFAYAAKEVYPMDRPGHWHHPYGFGTLGYALPAAIGGCIGRCVGFTHPTDAAGRVGETQAPTIAILGDYGFQYTVQELAVAVELELTLPIIIWDNGKLGEIEDSMVRAQIAPNAVIQRNPDFCKLAEAYGAAAVAPADLLSFQQDIKDALARKGPTLIHVKSDIALTSS
ncbi:thiamine pyrophosphate-binding protein [Yoonia sp. BS5-3]|uniref:Thiamine pyrophosphate-binding protein n=1 Tax=Yoonia phaeophyticola TaxID=3137369 RepID=A0ABZ2UZ89_9RHOB